MKQRNQSLPLLLSLVMGLSGTGCAASDTVDTAPEDARTEETVTESTPSGEQTAETECSLITEGNLSSALPLLNNSAWLYNEEDDVYYQFGISYCASPADADYETLGIYIPGAYMNAAENADGTFTCEINEAETVNGYTASTAPVLFPINTPGHKAQDAPDGYSKNCSTYTDEGYVYVVAGCRGKDAGVPAGVTDLKAAIRYIRYISEQIPGDMERIVVFGHSGGGSQSAVLGSSGDSALYLPYLQSIGAADTSDAVAAVMAWCPITSYDTSDLAYEWNMGCTRDGLSETEQNISDQLAEAYAAYVNAMEFHDAEGNLLTLEESEEGIYQAGTYYEYLKKVIETSLEHYLEDEGYSEEGAQSYIDSLNRDEEWIMYDGTSITISSIASFAEHCKEASKPIAAFDKLEEGGHELFNTGDGEKTHYDSVLYEIVKGTEYEAAVAEDIVKTDYLGNDMQYRINMFSPLYYLMENSEGYGTSKAASYWRIRSGITQGDTALTTEVNLALALNNYGAETDFETVWEQGHTQAERTGKGTSNFISWLNSCFQ